MITQQDVFDGGKAFNTVQVYLWNQSNGHWYMICPFNMLVTFGVWLAVIPFGCKFMKLCLDVFF